MYTCISMRSNAFIYLFFTLLRPYYCQCNMIVFSRPTPLQILFESWGKTESVMLFSVREQLLPSMVTVPLQKTNPLFLNQPPGYQNRALEASWKICSKKRSFPSLRCPVPSSPKNNRPTQTHLGRVMHAMEEGDFQGIFDPNPTPRSLFRLEKVEPTMLPIISGIFFLPSLVEEPHRAIITCPEFSQTTGFLSFRFSKPSCQWLILMKAWNIFSWILGR